jgi:FAD/FMN-containing dehydrogenase
MKEAAWFAGSGRKMEVDQVRAFEAFSGRFGNRFRWHERSEDDVVASILPLHADDVRWASQIATRCALPIVPVGAGTAPDDGSGARRNAVQIRFDLMSGVSLSKDDEEWVDAEPGATWLQLDNDLGRRGRGLAVYPTSAPRATVGGWLATDGIGIGSFEFGRLYENVISATVVGHGGEMREIGSDELGRYFMPMKAGNVVVGARLRTRRAATDRVFAAAFERARGLAGAVGDLASSETPLWHLAFVSPAMAAARGLAAFPALRRLPGSQGRRGVVGATPVGARVPRRGRARCPGGVAALGGEVLPDGALPPDPAGGTRVRWRRGPPPNTGRRRSGGCHPGDRLALRRDAATYP